MAFFWCGWCLWNAGCVGIQRDGVIPSGLGTLAWVWLSCVWLCHALNYREAYWNTNFVVGGLYGLAGFVVLLCRVFFCATFWLMQCLGVQFPPRINSGQSNIVGCLEKWLCDGRCEAMSHEIRLRFRAYLWVLITRLFEWCVPWFWSELFVGLLMTNLWKA